MENMLGSSKERPEPEQALKCPRCDSTNTKFCYYNNYSLTQPRYFCKSCIRYWTKGGTLRNIPVGGGCRKNKRSSSSKRVQDQTFSPNHNNPFDNSNDLSLAFEKQSCGQLGYHEDFDVPILSNSTSNTNHGLFDALRSGLFLGNGMHYNHNNVQKLYGLYGNGEVISGNKCVVMTFFSKCTK